MKVISIAFRLGSAQQVIFRHSVLSKDDFNFLFSDIDFSIICELKDFQKIFKIFKFLKMFLMNIGEIEIYTSEELQFIRMPMNEKGLKLWEKFYLIRKINWQKQKLNLNPDEYEIAKVERSLKTIFKKLDAPNRNLNGTKIFDFILNDFTELPPEVNNTKSFYSPFLEINISSDPTAKNKIDNLYFENTNEVQKIESFFPYSNWKPTNPTFTEVRKAIIVKELLISLHTQRIKKPLTDPILDRWIQELLEKLEMLNTR